MKIIEPINSVGMRGARRQAMEEHKSMLNVLSPKAKDDQNQLQKAVLEYLSECDNPVPDYNHRRRLRNRLRELTGAPAEPPPRSRS